MASLNCSPLPQIPNERENSLAPGKGFLAFCQRKTDPLPAAWRYNRQAARNLQRAMATCFSPCAGAALK